MKRIICFIMSFIILFISSITSFSSFETDYYEASSTEVFDTDSIPVWGEDSLIETVAQIQNKANLKIDSEAAILIDETTGTILYTKNEHQKLKPASVTKVMTLLLIMEALDRGDITLEDKVPCSERARKMGGSQIWLAENEELTVNEMLKAICVVSGNDCSMAMAEFIAGSEEAFVEKMNARAKELGMNDTTFKNCHGIDEDGHETSAYDISLMSRELSKNHPKIHDYTKIWMDTLRDGKSQLVNTNKLVRFYSGCTGLKTGSTSLALFNLSATATRNNLKLIAVVMKGPTSQKRFDDARTLLDYGFANFSNKVIVEKEQVLEKIQIEKSDFKEVEIIAENEVASLIPKGEEQNVITEIIYTENIQAPLEYREKVGTINCYLGDELLQSENLLVNQSVKKKNILNFLGELTTFTCKMGR